MSLRVAAVMLFSLFLLTMCSGKKENEMNKPLTKSQLKYGVGPVKNVELKPIDSQLADAGRRLFQANCSKCHMLDRPLLGPPLRDIANQRTPEFIMNMMLNPQEMAMRHPDLEALQKKYHIYMNTQGLDRGSARKILEYLRSVAPPDTVTN